MSTRNTYREDEQRAERFELRQFRRLGIYLKPFRWQIVATIAVVVMMSGVTVVIPLMTRTVIDQVIPQSNYRLLWTIAAILVTLLLIYELGMRVRTLLLTHVSQSVLKDMRRDLFTHMQELSFHYFDSRPHGKILVRIVNYVNTLSDTLSSGLMNVVADVFTLIVTLVVMFCIDAKLTLWSLVLLPVLCVWLLVIQHFQSKAAKRLSNKQSNINAFIHESIAGVKTTQAFAQEARQYAQLQEQQGEVRSAWMQQVHLSYLMWPGLQIVSVSTTALLYYVGIMHVGGVTASLGTLIAFITYTNYFWNPLIRIGNFFSQLVTCSAYLERIFEMLDEKPLITDRPDATVLTDVHGAVDFDNVSFSYDHSDDVSAVLHQVSMHISPGQTVALVGPTGAGKTTMISLLSRFYDVDSGAVLVDGHDVRSVTTDSLRQHIGVMLQDTFLFSGTIRDNIRYGRLNASDDDIEQAARTVHAHECIMRLPNGYDTVVEERGATFSAGQRQLIAFARVILANPQILILDEATSNIDVHTEEALQAGLQALLVGRTSIVIAHRLSTIEHADRIFVMDHGQIVESGTHEELLRQHGQYWKLYQAQFVRA